MSFRALQAAWLLTEVQGSRRNVLYALAGHHNDETDLCCPLIDTLAERAGVSARTVDTCIAELERDGFIKRIERRRKDGSRRGNAYACLFATHERLAELRDHLQPRDRHDGRPGRGR